MIATAAAALLDEPLTVALYGGKAARLSMARRAGLAAPPGFAVPVGTLDRFVRGAMADAEEAALLGLVRRWGNVPVAVRSSAVAEDSAGASFAGQHASLLNVCGADNILAALGVVWRSGHSAAARAYRDRLGVGGAPQVAALVQQLVPATVSGILFTADPLRGDRDRWVAEATWGLGDAAVAGLVTPDYYLLTPAGAILERRPGCKDMIVVPDTEGGTAEVALSDPALISGLSLDDAMLGRLLELGHACEALFGPAQDIEWAIAADTLYLLQARPITGAP